MTRATTSRAAMAAMIGGGIVLACSGEPDPAPPAARVAAVRQAVDTCFGGCGAAEKLCAGPGGTPSFDACVSIDDPAFGCDPVACDTKGCPPNVPHTIGLSTCAAGACVFGGPARACRPGWGNCDGDWKNGCETKLTTAAACGACGVACAAGQVCEGGACVAACTPPNENCGDGACQDLATSSTACACNVCGDTNGTSSCVAGKCQALACEPGFGACAKGCCDYQTDPTSCGTKNNACKAPTGYGAGIASSCVAGKCVAQCAPGYSACGTACVDLLSDPKQCGACGVVCAAGETCLGGGCTPTASLEIANGFGTVRAMVGDAGHLYIHDGSAPGKIWSVDKTTFAKTMIATSLAAEPPSTLDTDGSHLYWRAANSVRRMPTAGGPIETLYPTNNTPSGAALAVDGTYVYWSDLDGVKAAPKAGGGTPALVFTGIKKWAADDWGKVAFELRVAGNTLYGAYSGPPANEDLVWSMDTVTRKVTTRAFPLSISGLVSDGPHLWYADFRSQMLLMSGTGVDPILLPNGGVGALQASTDCDGILFFVSAPPGGAAPASIYKVAPKPSEMSKWGTAAVGIVREVGATSMVLDETHVYWTTNTTLSRALRSPTVVAPPPPADAGASDATSDASTDATADGGASSSSGASSGASGASSSGASSGSSSGGASGSSSGGASGSSSGSDGGSGGCATAPTSTSRSGALFAALGAIFLLRRRRRLSRAV